MQKQGGNPQKTETDNCHSQTNFNSIKKKTQSVNSYIHRNQGLNPKNLNIVPKKQKPI